MGLKGSSTARLVLEDAEVPVANLLHEEGLGHQVAFERPQFGPFQASRRDVARSSPRCDRASSRKLRQRAKTIWPANRPICTDPTEALVP